MAQSSSIFLTASDARQNPNREYDVHEEARLIETAVLSAVKHGYFEAVVNDGTPMTKSHISNQQVWSVDYTTSQIYIPDHQYSTGDCVTVSSTVTLPSPLAANTFYYCIYVDADHIKLATSLVNASQGRPISIAINTAITQVLLTEQGSGYIQPPKVGFAYGNATATAYLASWGSLVSISNSTSGAGYIDQPIISISSQGTNASVSQVVYTVVGISISNAGSSYHLFDIISVNDGTGTNATATITQVDVSGAILSIILNTSGSYTVLPPLSNASTTAIPSGGLNATVNLTIGIKSIILSSGGTGYTAAPRVKIDDMSGTGAVAIATVSGGIITGVTVTNPGYGYVGSTTVTLDSGTGAMANAVLQPTGVADLLLTYNGGNTYTDIPQVTIDAIGSGAEAGQVIMTVVNCQLTSPGSGYMAGDYLLVAGGNATTNAAIKVITVDQNGGILSYTLDQGGSYLALPGLISNPVNGGNGILAGFNLSMGVGSIQIGDPGNGYAVPPVVTVSAPNVTGSPATVHAVLTGNQVSEFMVAYSGIGYTEIPTVTVSNGSGATAQAQLVPTTLGLIPVSNPGYSYTTATVVISGGGATRDATATANIVGDGIGSITVDDPGEGYTSRPTITITGDGANATANAILTATPLQGLTVTNRGSGFNTIPSVTIDGQATGYATLVATGIDRIVVTEQGQNYTADPTVVVIPGYYQQSTPNPPALQTQRGFSIANIAVTYQGDSYQIVPAVIIAPPQYNGGTQATAIAIIGAGAGAFTINPYLTSQDYFKAWKGQQPSIPQLTKPLQERMDTVIAYFTNMGYTINRITNPTTNQTLQWYIQW